MAEPGAGGGKSVVLALVGEELLGPCLLHDLDGLDEQLAALFRSRIRVGMELRSFVAPDPAPESHLDAPLGEVVEDREVLGEPDRMPPHRDVGHLPDAYAGGAGGDIGPDEDRIGQIASTERLEVVLPDPHGVKPQVLGQDHLLAKVLEHLIGRTADRRQGGEDRETHGPGPWSWRRQGRDPAWPGPRPQRRTAFLFGHGRMDSRSPYGPGRTAERWTGTVSAPAIPDIIRAWILDTTW